MKLMTWTFEPQSMIWQKMMTEMVIKTLYWWLITKSDGMNKIKILTMNIMGVVTYLDTLTNDQIFIWKPNETLKNCNKTLPKPCKSTFDHWWLLDSNIFHYQLFLHKDPCDVLWLSKSCGNVCYVFSLDHVAWFTNNRNHAL